MARTPVQPVAFFIGGSFVPEVVAERLYAGFATHFGPARIKGLKSAGVGPLENSYQDVARWIKTQVPRGQPIVLIGQSQGGMHVVRYAAENPWQVHSVITISTPHHGTHIAKAARILGPLGPGLREMEPGSAYMQRYASWLALVTGKLTSIYLSHDWVILPSTSAHVEGATNHCLEGANHLTELFSRRFSTALQNALRPVSLTA